MIAWAEDRTRREYTPPDDYPPPPTPPRLSWHATADDGAELHAFRWGSVLGEPFVLEVRRYAAPAFCFPCGAAPCHDGRQTHAPPAELGPELPALAELQGAADQLVPPGTLLLLAVGSNGPDATYPRALAFRCVRLVQAATVAQMPPRSRVLS